MTPRQQSGVGVPEAILSALDIICPKNALSELGMSSPD
jgi:hypothetical protein